MKTTRIRPIVILYVIYDLLAINFALFFSFYFRYGEAVLDKLGDNYLILSLLTTIIFMSSYLIFSFYQRIWYHAGLYDHFYAVVANVFAGFFLMVLQVFLKQIQLSFVLMTTIMAAVLTLGGRMAYRVLRYNLVVLGQRKQKQLRTLVVGAGNAGNMAVNELKQTPESKMQPVAVVDDDPIQLGRLVNGVPVVALTDELPKIVKQYEIDLILIAIPSLEESRRREILKLCRTTGKPVKSMLGIHEFRLADDLAGNIHDVDQEVLLGKLELHFDEKATGKYFKNKSLLITGAAGSMGSRLARLLSSYKPRKLLLLDINESGLVELNKSLAAIIPENTELVPVVASTKEKERLAEVLSLHKPELIFHCAFHNNEDFVGSTPAEVINNNVYGTYNLLSVATELKTEKVLLLSDVTAALANNIVTASKRVCEMMFQGADKRSATIFATVRFDDLNQNAHYYLQRFKEQIDAREPLTIEHEEISRFFASTTDAAKLILEAMQLAQGGEVFSLDLGKPIAIMDLARNYAELRGYDLGTDLELQITGEIKASLIKQKQISDAANMNRTAHQRIYTSRIIFDNYDALEAQLQGLKIVVERGDQELARYKIQQAIKELVPEYYGLEFDDAGTAYREIEAEPTEEKKRIWLSSPHLGNLEKHYVDEAFASNWVAPLGPNVNEFEKELCHYVQSAEAAAMSSGTAAIHVALRLLETRQNDYVFCSSLTFSASANPIIYEKGIPIFIDSEPESWNMSPLALEKAFLACKKEGKLPKAVITVNLYGQSADYDKIKSLCDYYKVPIIEDAAESLGATYKNRQTGTFGKYGVFSFNGNKIITTSGGGMLISDDEAAIKKARFMITQARDPARHYQHSELGFNYRMSNVSAGIGRGQLQVLPLRIERKKEIYQYYARAFQANSDIEMMPIADYGEPNYWLSTITLAAGSKVKPLDIMLALEKENIESRPVWKPMHLQPFYEEYPFFSHLDGDNIYGSGKNLAEAAARYRGAKPKSIAEDLFKRGVCLPSDTKMTDEDLARVVAIIQGLFM